MYKVKLSSTFSEINHFTSGGVPAGHGDLYNFTIRYGVLRDSFERNSNIYSS